MSYSYGKELAEALRMLMRARRAESARPKVRIVKAIQTCWACPSQWDAWTEDGTYLYLRFRHGHGTVRTDLHGDRDLLVAEFDDPDPYAGCISLSEFCERAGIELAEGVW